MIGAKLQTLARANCANRQQTTFTRFQNIGTTMIRLVLLAVNTIRVIALSYRGAIRAFLPLFRFRLVSLFLNSAHECCDSNKKKNNNNNKQGK
jgi:hypothetical protein